MEFSLLGALAAADNGRSVRLGGTKERALLTCLLLHANEHVPRDQLIEELWGERPPASASHGLDVYVSRLRKLLGDGAVLSTHSHGYVLELDPERIDANRFERLLEEGRQALAADDAARAATLLREALSLWRGEALSDLRFEPMAELAALRLDERRLVALELRIDAEIALGEGGALVGELEELSRAHPLRERFRAQLMLALYRAGRQADALAVYRQTRAQLVEELGIEPGRKLEELEQAILRHDPALDGPASVDASPPAAPEPSRSRRLRPVLAAAAAAALMVVAAAAAAILLLWPTPGGLSHLSPDAIGLVDARSHEMVTEVMPGAAASRIVYGLGGLWVASATEPTVTHIDPQTRTVRQTIIVGGAAAGIAVGRRAVWATDGLNRTLVRLDPETHTVVQTVPTGETPGPVATGFGSLWVTLPGAQALLRVDERTGEVVERIETDAGGHAIAVGAGSVWLSDDDRNRVVRVDPATNGISASVPVGHGPTALAFAGDSLWVANALDGTVSRVDPRTNAVTAVTRVLAAPEAVAAAAGSIWVGGGNGDLLQLDPQTAAVAATVRTRQPVTALAGSPDGIWAAVGAVPAEHRGGTLRIRAPSIFDDRLDPAVDATVGTWMVLLATNDGLTTFRKTSGTDGTRLIPDLARSLPLRSDGGKTYTVKLRRGIRYSNGRPVRAADVRFTFERIFALESTGAAYYSAIVGADACLRKPEDCDLRRGIVVHGDTVTFHLTAADPEFSEKLALPYAYLLPEGIELGPASTTPATGPYRVARYGTRIELVRNPLFRPWSQAAQPGGYPDRIVIEAANDPEGAVAAVQHGAADFALAPTPLSQETLAELRTRYSPQLRTWAFPDTAYFFLNTTLPPFDDVRVRKALNYALDRRAFVDIHGGSAVGEPTCQVLPPGLPGYRPYCPYTVDPDRSGAWHAPDLAAARKLVTASGTRGQRIVVWHYGGITAEYAREAARTLRSLGYETTVRAVGAGGYGSDVQIGYFEWVASYPLPADYFTSLLSCAQRPPAGFNLGRFCNPRLDALMKRARALEQTDTAAANTLWARVEREIVDQAAWVPILTPRHMDVVSRRLGNFAVSPVWGPLLSQLWVR